MKNTHDDTPMTDAAVKSGQDYWGEYIEPEFARDLERQLRLANIDQANTEAELNEARKRINDLMSVTGA